MKVTAAATPAGNTKLLMHSCVAPAGDIKQLMHIPVWRQQATPNCWMHPCLHRKEPPAMTLQLVLNSQKT
jgi:hypothetical protein